MDYRVFDNYQHTTPLTLPPQNLATPISEQPFIKTELFDPNYSIAIDDPNDEQLSYEDPKIFGDERLLFDLPPDLYSLLMNDIYPNSYCLAIRAVRGENREAVIDRNGNVKYKAVLINSPDRTPHHVFNPNTRAILPKALTQCRHLFKLNVVYLPVIETRTHFRLNKKNLPYYKANNLLASAHITYLASILDSIAGKISKYDYDEIVAAYSYMKQAGEIPSDFMSSMVG